MSKTIKNEKEMLAIGEKLAAELKGGDILCLYGELGAGKTTLTKGLALGLGIKDDILSPTFTLMNVYENKKIRLVHIDTYRLKDEKELLEIGVEDYLGEKNTICVIEWPEKIENLLKNKKNVKIFLQHHGEMRSLEKN